MSSRVIIHRSRVDTRHVLTNTSSGYSTQQVIRVNKPSLVTSGAYTCKVATFTSEMIASHSLLIFGELFLTRFLLPIKMMVKLYTAFIYVPLRLRNVGFLSKFSLVR